MSRGHQALTEHLAAPHLHAAGDSLVTRQELAGLMRVSVATVDRLIADGLPTVRFSPGSVRLWANEAMSWAAARYENGRVA